MLYELPRPTDTDRRVLDDIDTRRDALQHAVQRVPTTWTRGLRRQLTASAIAASNTIEGYSVPVESVGDLMDGEREGVRTSEENKAETLAHQQAMTYIRSLHDAADFRYEKSLLNGLHFILQGHHHPHPPSGRWRTGPVRVTAPGDPMATDYQTPDADLVPDLIGELVDWLNSGDLDTHHLLRAAMAHFNLVKIHPWNDGNGRMSRSLQTLVLARSSVLAPEFASIEEWLGMPEHTWAYYAALKQVGGPVYSPGRDLRPWIELNLRAYHEQTQRVQHRVDRSNTAWQNLEDLAGQLGLRERQITALHDAVLTRRVRRLRYEHSENLTTQQAGRDLTDLTTRGLLTAHGQTKGRYYTPGPNLPAPLIEAARTPYTITNPYQA
ncbi:Fic family protein [Streptomyces sp. NPDC058297]|uniref:Fic family protein n=1 Tax=Streptomyces sp. NPDC058297 TaxID=3346433 RepID=UPI0036E138D8